MGTDSINPLTLPELIRRMNAHPDGSPLPLAIAVGSLDAAIVARLARRLRNLAVVVHTPAELFWLLEDERVAVKLVVGDTELPTVNGHSLLSIVIEEWPRVSVLLVDGERHRSTTAHAA